jgi:osmotically-inducible protein OsmY
MMGQLRYTMLISALAAAALASVGCEQKTTTTTDRMTQTNPPATTDQTTTSSTTTTTTSGKVATAMDDTMITTKVKAALMAEPGLKSTQIDVTTKDATVTLSGVVDSQATRDRAKQIALSTEGVKDVVDNMNPKAS